MREDFDVVQRNRSNGDDQGFEFGTTKRQVVAIDEGLLHSQPFAFRSCPQPGRRGVSGWSAGSFLKLQLQTHGNGQVCIAFLSDGIPKQEHHRLNPRS